MCWSPVSRSAALQPLSVEGEVGLNVAVGVGAVDLKPTS
jgi:hypothetical protein